MAARTGTTSLRRISAVAESLDSRRQPLRCNTAYAAINTLRLDDLRPHIYRTRDGGKTWTEIVSGIPDNENVNVVREDPERKGLLFAGTERAVYVSFDDGDHWQSLRLNMPATSVRDLIMKDDDLAVGTHGRGFWILDDITPLRQIDNDGAAAVLFEPHCAIACIGICGPTRHCRPTSRPDRIRPTARSSTIIFRYRSFRPCEARFFDSAGKARATPPPALTQSRAPEGSPRTQHPYLLGPSAPAHLSSEPGSPPFYLGPAPCPRAGYRGRISDGRDLSKHTSGIDRTLGTSGELFFVSPDRQRPELQTTAQCRLKMDPR